MRSRALILGLNAALALLCSATCAPLRAEDGPPDLQQLVGSRIDIQQLNEKKFGDVEVMKVVPGAAAGSIRALTAKLPETGKVQTFNSSTIDEIVQAGTPLDVSYDKAKRELVHDPKKREARLQRLQEIDARMEAKRERFWEDIPDAQQAEHVAEQKEFLEDAGATMGVPMQLLETRYYLFYTDMPLNTVGVFVQYLDSMYENLTKAFNFPEGKNIWRGKCPVVAFSTKELYQKFEAEVMDNPSTGSSQGLCHSYSDGRVVISCFRGDDPAYFATLLVHETAHGFVHRYRSTAHIPSWINEGIAEWVAATVVKGSHAVQDRQAEAVQVIRSQGNLGGDFFADRTAMTGWKYGAASSIVEILLRTDPKKYRLLIDGIKEGLDSDEALQEAYGMTFAELARRYGALAGVPNLTP